jgi:hypothetical protein
MNLHESHEMTWTAWIAWIDMNWICRYWFHSPDLAMKAEGTVWAPICFSPNIYILEKHFNPWQNILSLLEYAWVRVGSVKPHAKDFVSLSCMDWNAENIFTFVKKKVSPLSIEDNNVKNTRPIKPNIPYWQCCRIFGFDRSWKFRFRSITNIYIFFQGLRRQILFQVLLIYNAFRSIPEPPTPTEQTKERLEFALGPHTLLEAETGLALTLMREIFSS